MSSRMQSFPSSLLRRVICRNVSSAVLVAFAVSIFGSARIAAEELTLEQAIRTALTHRAELRGAENLVESAQGLRKQAAAHPNPRVVYQSENLRSGMDFSGNVDTYAYASQVLEISGKRGARIGLAQTGLGRAELNRDLLQRDISLAVAQVYWDAVRISYLCKLAEENEGFFREILDYHQKRFEEGKIAAVDVMRVRLESAKAQSRGETIRLAKVQAMQKLAQEMGMPTPGVWTLNADFETLNNPRSESLAEKSFEQRTDVKLARQRIDAASAYLRLQQAQSRPDLDALFGYKRTSGNDTMLAGMQINLPLFDRNRGGIDSARSDLAASREALTGVELKSESEFNLACTAYQAWKRQVTELYAPMVTQSNDIANTSRAAYREGGMDLLRLLDAERIRIETQTAWAEALGNYHQSVLSLNYAAGLEP